MIKPLINCGNPSIQKTKYVLLNSYKLLEYYDWLINSYVLDFYTCSHWDNLPRSWKKYFTSFTPQDLQAFLNVDQEHMDRITPLELIALKVLIKHLCIPRNNLKTIHNETPISKHSSILTQNDKIQKLFWKHVKMKKIHEIKLFAQCIYRSVVKTQCFYVIDVGSGLGHLSRLLAYAYGLRICGIEAQEKLCLQAKKLDDQFEKFVQKCDINFLKTKQGPKHLNYLLKPYVKHEEFLQIVLDVFGDSVSFGIVGLHPCGDLGPTLLNLYRTCNNIKFINLVGCCYMKLTTDSNLPGGPMGYPMSEFSIQNEFYLSYNAREIACHAIESYIDRLKSGQYWQLKVHSYRAVIETLIIQVNPNLKHSPLANVKYEPNMTFSDYCSKALKKSSLNFTDDNLKSDKVSKCLDDWKLVVIFYSIRLLFAPLVETMILLDRYLYLHEDGECSLTTVFDPKLSPRNHVLIGTKKEAADN